MPQTKKFSTESYRRVPYKDSIYRSFEPQPAEISNPPSQDPSHFGPTRKLMARPKRFSEMKNPSGEGGIEPNPKEMMRRMLDEEGI